LFKPDLHIAKAVPIINITIYQQLSIFPWCVSIWKNCTDIGILGAWWASFACLMQIRKEYIWICFYLSWYAVWCFM